MRETKNIMAGSSSQSKVYIISTQMNLVLLLFLSRLGAIGKVSKISANLLQHATYEGSFHGQNKYKIRVSVYFWIHNIKLNSIKARKLSNLPFKVFVFLGQNRIKHTKLILCAKGQLISKGLFGVFNSS